MLRIPGVILYFQPVQDIQIATRISRAQYQYTLTGTSAAEVEPVGGPAGGAAAILADHARRRLRGAGRGPAAECERRPRARRPARRLAAGRQRHAQLGLRPAPDLDHLRAVEPVPRHPGGDAAVSERPEFAVAALRARHRRRAGAAVGVRALRAHHRAAGDRALRAVPGGDHQLQPGAARLAQRRGGDHRRRPSASSACRPR